MTLRCETHSSLAWSHPHVFWVGFFYTDHECPLEHSSMPSSHLFSPLTGASEMLQLESMRDVTKMQTVIW